MSRWVVPAPRGGNTVSSENREDGAAARITKYIPAEILSAYTILFTLLVSMDLIDSERQMAIFGLIALFFLVTVTYIWKKSGTGVVRRAHLLVSPLAFLAWSYPISSALIGEQFFYPLLAFAGQAVVIALSIFIRPVE